QRTNTMNTDGHLIFHHSTPLFGRNPSDPAAWHTQNPTCLLPRIATASLSRLAAASRRAARYPPRSSTSWWTRL
ncbi:hypothetical protein THAOC_15860, partial [Thalassiosira oceanica]